MITLLAERKGTAVVLRTTAHEFKARFTNIGYRPTKATKKVRVNCFDFRLLWRDKASAVLLWDELGDIPCSEQDDQEIDEPFLHFEKGTDKYDIWNWFEEFFNLSVAEDLMFVN